MALNNPRPPTQTEPLWVDGPPEGRDYAPPGFIEVDIHTGIHWLKLSRQEFNTGWGPILTHGGPSSFSIQGAVAPEGIVAAFPGTFYRRSDENNYEFWYKESGSGTTGWYLTQKLL